MKINYISTVLAIIPFCCLTIHSLASCPGGITGQPYDADWGPASTSSHDTITCLTITNDRRYDRHEVAFSGIPISKDWNLRDDDLEKLIVVGAENRRVAAQFNVLSRWGTALTSNNVGGGAAAAAIRWLQVAIPVAIGSDSRSVTFELRRYDLSQARAIDVSTDVQISGTGGDGYTVRTGPGEFVLDKGLGAIVREIKVNRSTLLSHSTNNAGPSITFIPQRTAVYGSSPRTLTSDQHGSVDYFEVTEVGPVKVTVMAEGTLSDPSGASLCNTRSTNDPAPYESFTYSLALTFFRGKTDIKVQYHIRNQCSNGDGSDWTDQAFSIVKASYSLSFDHGIPATSSSMHLYNGASDTSIPVGVTSQSLKTTIVEQRKGGGAPWRRRARVTSSGSTIASGVAFNAPIIGIANGSSRCMVAIVLAYMRYREPQALRVTGSTMSFDVVSETQRVGEGKGLWNHGMIIIRKWNGTQRTYFQNLLQLVRWPAVLEVERGLLLHAPPEYSSSTGVVMPLGYAGAPDTPIKTAYLSTLTKLHDDTVSPNGQWERAKRYGSQIWPDVEFDGYQVDAAANPAQSDGRHGYWNPHAHELAEFLRSGDPKWVHDFALPLSWLMTYTAYLNVGRQTHDWVRNGLCINSGGSGDGDWHRSAFGSDDYMYNLAMKYAYPLRPDPIHRRRIEITGRTVRERYPRSTPEPDRDIYLEKLDVARGVIQHYEAEMNCAEFGQSGGVECQNHFLAVMQEFVEDNLSAGSICQPDIVVGQQCEHPQTFMIVSMMYEFFVRVYSNYGNIGNILRNAIVGIPSTLYKHGIQMRNGNIVYRGDHAALLGCTTNSPRTQISSCVYENVGGDGRILYEHNINSLLSSLLIAHSYDSNLDFCRKVQSAWSNAGQISATWLDVDFNDAGWTKPTSQMMSLMAYGVGMMDDCLGRQPPTTPPPPTPRPPVVAPSAPTPRPPVVAPSTPTPRPRVPTPTRPTRRPRGGARPTRRPRSTSNSCARHKKKKACNRDNKNCCKWTKVKNRFVCKKKPTCTTTLLYTTLDSKSQTINPKIGTKGSVTVKKFVEGKKGKGALYPANDGTGQYIRYPIFQKRQRSKIRYPIFQKRRRSKNRRRKKKKQRKKQTKNIDLTKGSLSFYYKPMYAADANDVSHALVVIGNDIYNPPNLVLMESDTLSVTVTDANYNTYGTASAWRAPLWKARQWVTIRVEWDSAVKNNQDSLKIFVNGERVDDGREPGDWSLGGSSSIKNIYVGCGNDKGDFPADGIIDDFKIFG